MNRKNLRPIESNLLESSSLPQLVLSPSDFEKQVNGLKQQQGLIRNQAPLPSFTVYLPSETIDRYKRLGLRFVEGLTKVAYQVLRKHPSFPSLQELGFTPAKINFLQHNIPETYEDMMVLGRLDMTTDGTKFLTYEFNGSQPGGLEYAGFFAHPLFSTRGGGEHLLSLYRDYFHNTLAFFAKKSSRSQPRGILLLSHNYHLIDGLRESLEQQYGHRLFLSTDASTCSIQNRTLFFQDARGRKHPIDLVMRSPRASFERLLERENTVLRKAWREGHVVLVNPPHSKIVGWKTLYVYLQQEKLLDLAELTDEEREAIASILPPIIVVTPRTASACKTNKDEWVLKNTLRGRGTMVWLGPETAQKEWNILIDKAAHEKGWICQQFRPPFQLPIVVHDRYQTRVTVPITIDPYVSIGDIHTVPGFLCRAVIPTHQDEAELQNVKLNLLGQNQYVAADGSSRERTIGFGHLAPAVISAQDKERK